MVEATVFNVIFIKKKKKNFEGNERSSPKVGYTNVKIGHHINNQAPWDNSVL